MIDPCNPDGYVTSNNGQMESFAEGNMAILLDKPKKVQLIVAATGAVGILAAVLILQPKPSPQKQAIQLPSPSAVTARMTDAHHKQPEIPWHNISVHSGDTLDSIFAKQHIPAKNLWAILKLHDPHLTLLRPGKNIGFQINSNHQLTAMRIPLSINQSLLFTQSGDHYQQKKVTVPIKSSLSFKQGHVDGALASSALKAGMSYRLFNQFAAIFHGQVNFSHDIHSGDHFAILYREDYLHGKKIHAGDIVAAELITQHKTLRAVRYSYPKNHVGYFTPDGHSVEHRFLTYPVKFKRISSHFSRHRLDPVVHFVRPHLGVDFAAYRGTPIHSIGNGRITFIGRDHGYGNAIKVHYDRHYSALYAHMKKFAKNLKLHQYVHKGQVIGYVGSTGWSTGPHLHFGIYVNGIARNWLALKPPVNLPIPRLYQKRFKKRARQLLAELKLHEMTVLASN